METTLSTFQTYTLLISCAISLSCISYSNLRRNAKAYRFLRNIRSSHKRTRYSSIPVPTVPPSGEITIEDGRIISQDTKGSPNEVITELRRPRGALFITLLECCILLGAICINITTTSTDVPAWNHQELTGEISRLTAWIYIATIAWLRLLFMFIRSASLPKLWRHTASLYCVQWGFILVQFYSAGSSTASPSAEKLQAVEFILSSCLALIAVSTRDPQGVVITHQAELMPSKEPFASILSLATFNWVNTIVWHGNKKDFNLGDVWDLQRRDQASQLLERFGRLPRSTRLLWRLLSHFKRNFVLQMSWSFLGALLTFAPTLLLKAILEYMENPEGSSRSTAWLYVTLLAVSGCMYGVADGQAAWMGRKNGVQMESILIGEIHAETLRRKIKASKHTGTVTNLLSVDAFQVGEACSYVHDLFPDAATQFVVAAILLFSTLGKSALASFLILALLVPLNVFFGRLFTRAYRGMMKGMDARSEVTNEVLRNVKLIKYFAWEQRFIQSVDERREVEVKALRNRFLVLTMATGTWLAVPLIITAVSFFFYTVVEKKPLLPSIAFTSLTLIGLLRIPLDRIAVAMAQIQQAKTSIDRIQAFLDERENEGSSELSDDYDTPYIGFKHASISWEDRFSANKENILGANSGFQLVGIDVAFHKGGLNIITGPIGSGKSTLLTGLLGELSLLEGSIHLPRYDGIAYCAQEAWLLNKTVKENILFSSPWDEDRYQAVIEACSLTLDLETLPEGDQTSVADRGLALSGGQKQRISLARAAYSTAKNVLLDDCLSAVDSNTAQHIFTRLLLGPLMANRTIILVTHGVALCAPRAQHIVILDNGRIAAQGSYGRLVASGDLDDETQTERSDSGSSTPSRSSAPTTVVDGATSVEFPHLETSEELETKPIQQGANERGTANVGDQSGALPNEALSWNALKLYLGHMGAWHHWFGIFIAFAAESIAIIATNNWIRKWSSAYHEAEKADYPAVALYPLQSHSLTTGLYPNRMAFESWHSMFSSYTTFLPDVSNSYYLGTYGLLAFTYILAYVCRCGLVFKGSLSASRTIHSKLLASVLGAQFSFFDTTPVGQIVNRFSKDLQVIDQNIALTASRWLQSMIGALTIVLLISIVTPAFLLVAIVLTIFYGTVAVLYVKAARNLKRMEASQRSPLYQHFNETLGGAATIRAYGCEEYFIRINHHNIDTHNRPYVFLLAATRWLGLRINFAGALVAFFATAFALINIETISPAAAGLSLSYALSFNETILWVVRLFTENEQNMTHMERVKTMLDVDQEAPPINPDFRPPGNWPGKGAVQFIEYSTRYRPDLQPVLRNLNMTIRPQEKIGIVGRTGAGKSSLAMALMRGLEADTGRIIIDGIDIGQLGLWDLREAIAFVPQDPTLFTGTIRTTLDPFGLYTDEEVLTALRRVHLIESPSSSPPTESTSTTSSSSSSSITALDIISTLQRESIFDSHSAHKASLNPSSSKKGRQHHQNTNLFHNLSSPVTASGSNISLGQRQLLCLARVLLKSPRILIMDEATASIDALTDAKIQSTIRELSGSTTILTIAHRLRTIVDYDRVLVLDGGRVVEFDRPGQLLRRDDGIFRAMCEVSGDFEGLVHEAEEAERRGMLVDV